MKWILLALMAGVTFNCFGQGCHKAVLDQTISDSDEMMFQQLMYNALDDDGNNEAIVAFHALAEFGWAKSFVKSVNFVPLVKQVTEHAIERHTEGYPLPEPEEVEKAYDRFLAHQMLYRLETPEFQTLYCQAASDAATYFLEIEKFGKVQKYDEKLDDVLCDKHYHSWRQVNPLIEARLKK